MDVEEQERIDSINRYIRGNKPTNICRDVGRSKTWLFTRENRFKKNGIELNWSFYLTIGMFIVALISVIFLFIGWLNRQKEKLFENGIQKGPALIEQPNFLGVDEVIIPRHMIILKHKIQ